MKVRIGTVLRATAGSTAIRALVSAIVLGVMLTPRIGASPQSRTYCFPIERPIGEWFLVQMQQLGSGTDSSDIKTRNFLGLPKTALASIKGVTEEAKCERASRAIDSAHVEVEPGSSLYLVRVGKHYMAFPPSKSGIIVHLDADFRTDKFIMQMQ